MAQLAEGARGNPYALLEVAKLYLGHGDSSTAGGLALRALRTAPNASDVPSMARAIFSKSVPAWHFEIVRDVNRNEAYQSALRRQCSLGGRVLDIGTGTGLLSMMAVRAGATRVFGCESNLAMAEIAKVIVRRNGFEERITIIDRHSAELDVDRDLGGKVDVIVSEIVSNDLLSQQVLPVIQDAVHRCLNPGGRVIPSRAAVRIALANYSGPRGESVGTAAGFDLSPLNEVAGQARRIRVGDPALELRGPDASVFDFDFESGGPFRRRRTVVQLESNGGVANGIAQWMALTLDEDTRYENRPGQGQTSCWSVLFYPFSTPRNFDAGSVVEIQASHDLESLYLSPNFERASPEGG